MCVAAMGILLQSFMIEVLNSEILASKSAFLQIKFSVKYLCSKVIISDVSSSESRLLTPRL